MKFRSNPEVGIAVNDLRKAEEFYSKTMGFKLKRKSKTQLVYQTGHFKLYVMKASKTQSPVPSFTVKNVKKAKQILRKNKCKVIADRGDSLWFRDPFGI